MQDKSYITECSLQIEVKIPIFNKQAWCCLSRTEGIEYCKFYNQHTCSLYDVNYKDEGKMTDEEENSDHYDIYGIYVELITKANKSCQKAVDYVLKMDAQT